MELNLTKEESNQLLDLRKNTLQGLCLEKPQLNGLKSRVGVVLDFSGSMRPLYDDGTVQAVLEKLLPIALQFDDNGEMEFWIFDDGFRRLENIHRENYYGYVNEKIIGKYRMGATSYAPVLKDVRRKYMNEDREQLPNYVIFITDGDNSDRAETQKIIREMSMDPIFIQFIGIGNATFSFLQELDDLDGRYVDNANFFKIGNIIQMQDYDLYSKLMTEYPLWIELSEVQKMILNQRKKGLFGFLR